MCHWIRQAAKRHLADLEDGPARGLTWDAAVVDRITLVFSALRHSKGEWAGAPIVLEDWQCFVLGSILGWRREDGTRRFRTAYIEIPRKNGKSTLAAGLGLYLAFLDGEPGAEVYSAATKRDQAMIVWQEARRMVASSPSFRDRIQRFVGNLNDPATYSKFEPLGADADNLDGLNVSAAIIDELHAHPNRKVWDVLETATLSRRASLLFAITTAGSNLASVCYEKRAYAEAVLGGGLTGPATDSFFSVIYTTDPGDKWDDPKTWRKANPNYGVSVKADKLAELADQARNSPSGLPAFLTRHLCVWIQSDIPWMPMDLWHAAGREPIQWASFDGAEAILALDLASKDDLAAAILLFRRDIPHPTTGDPQAHYYVRSRFYLPETGVQAGAHDVTAHYAGWAEQGFLTLTPGPVIDFYVIRDDIRAIARRHMVREIPHDPYNATMLGTELRNEGLPMVEVPQMARHLSAPMKELITLVKEGRLHHDANPVLTWNVANVRVREDRNENTLPTKPTRMLKIDGASALIMALSRAMNLQPSIYAERMRAGVRPLATL